MANHCAPNHALSAPLLIERAIRALRRAGTMCGVLSLVACATPPPNPPQAGVGPHGGHAMSHGGMAEACTDCPMRVPGTTVRAVEPDGAAALEFATTGDVAELRRRVTLMARMHNDHQAGSGKGCMMSGGEGMMGQGDMGHGMMADGGTMGGGMMADGGMMGGGMMKLMHAAEARPEEIPQGARLVFTPKDPADLPALRAQVQKHAEHAAQGGCPMMRTQEGQPAAELGR